MRIAISFSILLACTTAAAQVSEPPPTELTDPGDLEGPFIGAGLGMLAAGVGLDLLVFAVSERGFDDASDETGAALAIPTVLSTGGLFLLAGGIAAAAGGDERTIFLSAGITSAVGAIALLIAAIAVGFDEGGTVLSTPHEDAAMLLGVHAGTSLFFGFIGIVLGLLDLPAASG